LEEGIPVLRDPLCIMRRDLFLTMAHPATDAKLHLVDTRELILLLLLLPFCYTATTVTTCHHYHLTFIAELEYSDVHVDIVAVLAWPLARFQFQAKARRVMMLALQPSTCARPHDPADGPPATPAKRNTTTTATENARV
jgi:hypothetical protein